ncbi:MAG: hypothetical protein JSU70_21230 [Phycisphaerales bacterium]|nr:MAG: hypothetical protein JSU70_21230 [Phycisphaerales bacterium]
MAKSVNRKRPTTASVPRAQDPAELEPVAEEKKQKALSGWPMIIGWLAMLVFALHACTHMVAAGDTWVAMACGRHFVNHGVDTVEPFSANSHKPGPTEEEVSTWPGWAQWITDTVGIETVGRVHPTGWVNQNWLTHVIFYWLSTTLGSEDKPFFDALIYWKFAIYILSVICVYYTGRILGAHPALSAAFACFAMFIARSFLDVRPAGFSNLLVAVFLFILVLATYRNVLYIWLIVPLAVFWCNVHGGYVYVFIMLISFLALNLLTSISKNKFRSIGLRGICHTCGATFAALLAVLLFNPFHLTNLTHTFVISVSEHAERWRDIHEWHPAFDWENPVGTAVPFLVMYIIAWVALAVWVLARVVTSRSADQGRKRKKAASSDQYEWPKVDLPLMAIAALTIYMAVRSRRFIPIAAFAACPVISMLVDQIIRAISATINYHKHRSLAVPQMPRQLQFVFIVVGAAVTLFLGTWWGARFKLVYLDAWPADPKLSSIFMRMTASDAKPFNAMKFVKMNKLKGKMFNYWTEGGCIAWGQEPDPNTGKTPLQLFMDGRAQAAYDRRAFDLWSHIISGGPTVAAARTRQRGLTADDYQEIGRWVGERLEARDVWVVLMPALQFHNPFTRGLERNPKWPVVFFNNKQKLFVNYTTPQGKALFDGIGTGRTLYPDEFTRNLIIGHNLLAYGSREDTERKRRGLDAVVTAFNMNPSPAPMLEIILVAPMISELKPLVRSFCKNYYERFSKEMNDLMKQDGYRLRLEAARLACVHLQKVAQEQRDTKLAAYYAAERNKLLAERVKMSQEKRW